MLHVSDIVVVVIIVILSSQIVASWYRILSALANNYETVPSSLPSFLVPSPLVRDFTVAGDSWPSVQGRRAWYGSARDGVDKTEMDRAQTFA